MSFCRVTTLAMRAFALSSAKKAATHRAVFVTDALVQADLAQRIAAQKSQIEAGMLNPNEGRKLNGLGKRRLPDGSLDPEGDAYWRPANMASTAQPAQPDPDPTPKPTPNEGDDQ